MSTLDELKSQKYISLESYRKNNQPIRTPVWFVVENDLIVIVTRELTGKVKRIRNNQQVKIATCTMRGKITGKWISGIAKFLPDVQTGNVVKLRDKKYGIAAKIAKFVTRNKGDFVAFTIKLD
ncbi:PPOX class putative F420-dependent enzyme family protein [Candidatus Nitrosopumilus salaria BD31]|uniref:PPOX class putative F420-dependent enzyme family protein n=1 Tax=Candidatus Nitrosopumilus salarius BD31 TaxID=859350 RepID=I3D2M9_9ARCH|nr:PPOX class F420-dependent oxidoreductase [Candidatus Nitrosopumilus salaria]EIJ65972.1 PPOX class putative F420-dependent enzyme family protein [Candidatus Nitrosopumilus salaria BD31]